MKLPAEFLPRRWAVNYPESIGLPAPLPKQPAVDVKGTWLSDDD
jgi:hypothetical protein